MGSRFIDCQHIDLSQNLDFLTCRLSTYRKTVANDQKSPFHPQPQQSVESCFFPRRHPKGWLGLLFVIKFKQFDEEIILISCTQIEKVDNVDIDLFEVN